MKSKVGIAGHSGRVADKIEDMRCVVCFDVIFAPCLLLIVFLGSQQGLHELDISSMRLNGVPKDVLALGDLTHLNIGFNELAEFPNLTPLASLEFLDLSGASPFYISSAVTFPTELEFFTCNYLFPREFVSLFKVLLGSSSC